MNTADMQSWLLIKPVFKVEGALEGIETKETFAHFALPCAEKTYLFGRVYNDSRANQHTGEFADGNRIITTRVMHFSFEKVLTRNTTYNLGTIHPVYCAWLMEQGYDITRVET